MLERSESGFMRLPDVLKEIPVSKTVWYEGIKAGRYPKPVKISMRCVAWRVADIEAYKMKLAAQISNSGKPVA